ncbi:hypothetical protein MVEN_00069600 [Mycena venus]|uniref:Uncharacterized protein n=1 Tax=Mycena venus TaxID=2733690 RepID=A0A8H6Z3V7_9AGAR|nr:hypothetical protein MVEN_00069600 [Mycena venus]
MSVIKSKEREIRMRGDVNVSLSSCIPILCSICGYSILLTPPFNIHFRFNVANNRLELGLFPMRLRVWIFLLRALTHPHATTAPWIFFAPALSLWDSGTQDLSNGPWYLTQI